MKETARIWLDCLCRSLTAVYVADVKGSSLVIVVCFVHGKLLCWRVNVAITTNIYKYKFTHTPPAVLVCFKLIFLWVIFGDVIGKEICHGDSICLTAIGSTAWTLKQCSVRQELYIPYIVRWRARTTSNVFKYCIWRARTPQRWLALQKND